MNIIYLLLPIALLLGFSFAFAFVFSSMRGQFDDLETPAHRMLFEPDQAPKLNSNSVNDDLKGKTS